MAAWGDEGHRKGWCLYKMGCKGPVATFNCPTVRWNDGTNWPVGAGHPCIACAAPNFFERQSMYEVVDIQSAKPPALYPPVAKKPEPMPAAGAATLGAAGGLLVGAGLAAAVATTRAAKSGADRHAEAEAERHG